MLMELLRWKPKGNTQSLFKDNAHRKSDCEKGNFYLTDFLPLALYSRQYQVSFLKTVGATS